MSERYSPAWVGNLHDRIESLERQLDTAESVAQIAASDRDEALENFARAEQEYVALQELLNIATGALRDIGSRDILRASEIAWAALEQIYPDDEMAGETLERQRQPENQPMPAD